MLCSLPNRLPFHGHLQDESAKIIKLADAVYLSRLVSSTPGICREKLNICQTGFSNYILLTFILTLFAAILPIVYCRQFALSSVLFLLPLIIKLVCHTSPYRHQMDRSMKWHAEIADKY